MMARGDNRAGWAGLAALGLAVPMAYFGSLLIAPLVALCALVAFPVHRQFWHFERVPLALISGGLFLAWVGISFLWSPHDNPEQLPKTLLGIPLYTLLVLRVGTLTGRWRSRLEAMMIFAVVALSLGLFGEALMDGAMTRSFKVSVEEYAGLPARDVAIHVNRNLGHAVVPLLLLSGPAALVAWRSGGVAVSVLVLVLTGVAAFSFETEVNAAAFVLALLAAGLTALWPRIMMSTLFGVVAGTVIVVPVALPGIIQMLPQGLRDALPLSWSWRLEIWTYVAELIRERPAFGYGLDASRAMNRDLELAGYQVEALPHHPHNASLQVWLETGLVGAALLALTLVFLGGRIASAELLSRDQAMAAAWVFVSYVALVLFSYGVWQEWHQGVAALAAMSVLFLGARKPNQ